MKKKVRFGVEYYENKTVFLYDNIFSQKTHLLTTVCSCRGSLTVSCVQWEGSARISDKQILAENYRIIRVGRHSSDHLVQLSVIQFNYLI